MERISLTLEPQWNLSKSNIHSFALKSCLKKDTHFLHLEQFLIFHLSKNHQFSTKKHPLEGIVPLESHVPEGRFFCAQKTQHVQLRLSKADLKMVLTNTKSDQCFNPKSLSASKFQCIISMLLLDLKSCRKENIVSSKKFFEKHHQQQNGQKNTQQKVSQNHKAIQYHGATGPSIPASWRCNGSFLFFFWTHFGWIALRKERNKNATFDDFKEMFTIT